MIKADETEDIIYSLVKENQSKQYEHQGQTLPILWKNDKELGIAFFCPHCKVFQCSGSGACTECGGDIAWEKREHYTGKTYWKVKAGGSK